MTLPSNVLDAWSLEDGEYALSEQLYGKNNSVLTVADGAANFELTLEPLASAVLRIGE